jgi:hypothetical protein
LFLNHSTSCVFAAAHPRSANRIRANMDNSISSRKVIVLTNRSSCCTAPFILDFEVGFAGMYYFSVWLFTLCSPDPIYRLRLSLQPGTGRLERWARQPVARLRLACTRATNRCRISSSGLTPSRSRLRVLQTIAARYSAGLSWLSAAPGSIAILSKSHMILTNSI